MRNRRVPRYFQKLNDFFNMGEWKEETGQPKPEWNEGKDEIDLLMEQQQKKNTNFKKKKK